MNPVIKIYGSTQKLLYLSDVVDQNLWLHTEVTVVFTVINHYMMQLIRLKRRVSLGVDIMFAMKRTGSTQIYLSFC